MSPKSRTTFFSLLILFVVTTALVVFHGISAPFDQGVDVFLYHTRTPLLVHLFSLITFLGSGSVIIVFAVLIAIGLWFSRYRRFLTGFLVTLVGAEATSYILKILIARPRPLAPLPLTIDPSFSYPSGHATAAMALYGFLIYLIYRMPLSEGRKKLFVTLLVLLILLIGFSRLYLGMHFPTDVIGGYLVSLLWIMIGASLYRKIKTRTF